MSEKKKRVTVSVKTKLNALERLKVGGEKTTSGQGMPLDVGKTTTQG